MYCRGVFRTQSNIYDGAFLQKLLTSLKILRCSTGLWICLCIVTIFFYYPDPQTFYKYLNRKPQLFYFTIFKVFPHFFLQSFGSIYAIYKKWDNLTNLQINLSNSTKIADKTVMLPSPIFRREVKLICYRKSWNTILRKKMKQSKEHLYLRFYVYTHASMCR